jgi:cytochrome c biogenesis protein CcdA/thiol-disulfide isomerase/thioredoxin
MVALRSVLVALLMVLGLGVEPVWAGDSPAPVLTIFWGQGCPHCAAEWEFLEQLAGEYPDLEIAGYEVWYDEENRELFVATMEGLGLEARAVPTTVFGDRVWEGFSEAIESDIRAAVQVAVSPEEHPEDPAGEIIDLPLVGEVASGELPLVVSTALIALVDGVNPCSLWVLSILLALVLRTGSRRRVLAVGGTFLVVTALLYGLYIAGMYGLLAVVASETWVRITMALVALGFGLVSFKEYFRFGTGVSLGIAESQKPRLYRKMRSVSLEARSLPFALAGTVVLATGVSVLETPCTAGYPLLWANLLAEQQVGLGGAIPLFLLYMLIFLADELVVFGAAVFAMKATKLEERAGRLLRLVGGAVMVTLAATLIFAPQAMNSVVGSLGVFGIALGLVLVVLAGERVLRRRNRESLLRSG